MIESVKFYSTGEVKKETTGAGYRKYYKSGRVKEFYLKAANMLLTYRNEGPYPFSVKYEDGFRIVTDHSGNETYTEAPKQ